MRQRLLRYLLLLSAIALLAAGCGSGDSADTAAATAATETTESAQPTSTSSEAEESAPPSSGDSESPVADLLGIPLGDEDEMNEYFGQLQIEAERKISECMIAQGFEYRAIDYSQIDGIATDIDADSKDFVEEYGFGIASNPFDEVSESFDAFVDPNAEYLDSLSEGERDAYQEALTGTLPDFDPNGSDTGFDFEPSGCQGEAFEEAFAFVGVFEQFGGELEAAEAAYEADPRIVAASGGWAGCMADAGYGSYGDVEDARSDFERRYQTITSAEGAYEEIETDSSEVEGPVTFFGPRTLTAGAQAQADELAIEERAVALASWECEAPLREISDDVRREYEQRFVDENGAAIRAMLDG